MHKVGWGPVSTLDQGSEMRLVVRECRNLADGIVQEEFGRVVASGGILVFFYLLAAGCTVSVRISSASKGIKAAEAGALSLIYSALKTGIKNTKEQQQHKQ